MFWMYWWYWARPPNPQVNPEGTYCTNMLFETHQEEMCTVQVNIYGSMGPTEKYMASFNKSV